MTIKNILRFEEIIRNCGSILLKMKENNQLSYQEKGSQVKALADKTINEHLKKNIKKINPFALIVSEENTRNVSAHKAAFSEECFVIDPIDGTASFVKGYKGYVVQLAYIKKGHIVFSMVYAPESDDFYLGINKGGSYLNGSSIKVKTDFSSTIFIDNYSQPSVSIVKMMQTQKKPKYIECGSIGLKICKVAGGEADVCYKDVLVRDWDLIPPSLILEEAGGSLVSANREKIKYFNNNQYSHKGFVAVSHNDFLENLKFLD